MDKNMGSIPANIYEAGLKLGSETHRLRSFAWPTEVSIKAIGRLQPGMALLDLGAGSNTDLGAYARQHGAAYTAFDRNSGFLEQQRASGATAVEGDIRHLPFPAGSFNICHARFVLSHLGKDRGAAMAQVLGATAAGGRAIFMDYDWTAAHGTPAFNGLRDFLIGKMLFDATFGAHLEKTVRLGLNPGPAAITTARYTHPPMYDYAQVLNLRGAATADLRLQNAKPELLQRCNTLFDQLQAEAGMPAPPGFQFPDIVAVAVSKPASYGRLAPS